MNSLSKYLKALAPALCLLGLLCAAMVVTYLKYTCCYHTNEQFSTIFLFFDMILSIIIGLIFGWEARKSFEELPKQEK